MPAKTKLKEQERNFIPPQVNHTGDYSGRHRPCIHVHKYITYLVNPHLSYSSKKISWAGHSFPTTLPPPPPEKGLNPNLKS